MAGQIRRGQIKMVLSQLPKGVPFGVSELASLGVSRQMASHFASSGWLVRLGQGVYAIPGDEITRDGAVEYLQREVSGLHVAGKSALSLHGIRHYLHSQETLVLAGEDRFRIPAWFTSRFPCRYVSTHLFEWDNSKQAERSLSAPPGAAPGLRVSVPERALLELFHEVGVRETLDEARALFEGVRTLRKDVAGELLSCCCSVKAVRLFLALCRASGVLDVDELSRRFVLRVGSNARWMNRLPDGTLLTLKPYG